MGSPFDKARGEPLFMAVTADDAAVRGAHRLAAETIELFREYTSRNQDSGCAKLRFRDPDESERLGEDCYLYLWLAQVHYHSDENIFSGVFFEVPDELKKWHSVGQRLGFESEDVFDWMVNKDGHLFGGFTLRVNRNLLPEARRAAYDSYIGVSTYEDHLSLVSAM